MKCVQIPLEGDFWDQAVSMKRDRAFRMALKDTGFPIDKIEAIYAEESQKLGVAFHAAMLRQEIGSGALLGWTPDGAHLSAFAVYSTNVLLGVGPKLMVVHDVLVVKQDAFDLMELIVADLRRTAREHGCRILQVTSGAEFGQIGVAMGATVLQTTVIFRT